MGETILKATSSKPFDEYCGTSVIPHVPGPVFDIEQSLDPDPGILTGTMIKNTLQTARKERTLDELKAQQQLARIVSEVVTELENGTTQAMLKVCMKSQVTRAA